MYLTYRWKKDNKLFYCNLENSGKRKSIDTIFKKRKIREKVKLIRNWQQLNYALVLECNERNLK